MASNLLKTHLLHNINSSSHHSSSSSSSSLPFSTQQNHHHSYISFISLKPPNKHKFPPLSIHSSATPPSSKEEAILQAKTCLSSTLEKPLNNPKLAGKLKKLKQPRLRVEVPVSDDSPASLTELALQIFGDIPIKRKGGSPVKISLLWPNPNFSEAAKGAFKSHSSNQVENLDISSIANGEIRNLNSGDVLVFLIPNSSNLGVIRTIADNVYPKPVVLFNPRWGFEEEADLGELSGFVGSFEVVYSFMGLEVRGILSKRKGVIFKCVRDGVLSGERWKVLVEEGGGELKVISSFKGRPSIVEVETVLYNLMAINSPITKSAKFLRDLVSNVTGRK